MTYEFKTENNTKIMKASEKKVEKESSQSEFWTQSKIAFFLLVVILLFVFVAFMVLIFFTNLNYFSKY